MDTFLYFGYGSNLNRQRLHINCPSAEFVCAAKLVDYRLGFFNLKRFVSRWRGAVATIAPAPGQSMWGAVWRISDAHSQKLDKQEGIKEKLDESNYRRVEIKVTGKGSNEELTCRSYEIVDQSPELEGLPSPQYLQVITSGAEEIGLPMEYLQQLSAQPHNGYEGEVDIASALQPHLNGDAGPKTFLYFGYASNMNKKRLQVSCSSAEFVCAARLDNYKVKFVNFRNSPSRWCGAVACAFEKPGSVVWGALWKISEADQALLDRQEGSNVGLLQKKPITVYSKSGEQFSSYLYQPVDMSPELEGLPSPQYLEVIVKGAEESGLPEDYRKQLSQQPHNGYQGEVGLPDTP